MRERSEDHVTDGGIHISDWEQFLITNEYLMDCFNNLASACNDIIANVNTIVNNLDSDKLSSSLGGLPSEYKPVSPDFDCIRQLNNYTIEMGDYLTDRTYKFVALKYATEHNLLQYNTNGGKAYLIDINEIMIDQASIIADALKKTKRFAAIGFLLGYGTNQLKKGYEYDVLSKWGGSGAAYFVRGVKGIIQGHFDAIGEGLSPSYMFWVNTSVGSVIAGACAYYDAWKNDEGEWTRKDDLKAWWDASGATLSYVGAAVVGECIGGPLGALAAGGTAFLFNLAWDALKGVVLGPDVCHTFTSEDGIVYEVPGRGTDWEIEVDVLTERLNEYWHPDKEYISYRTGHHYTEDIYKQNMYGGTELFEREFLDTDQEYDVYLARFKGHFIELFNPRFTNFSSREEFYEAFNREMDWDSHTNPGVTDGEYNPNWDSPHREAIYDAYYDMHEVLGFDAWEYYNYLKTGSYKCD